MHKKVRTIGLYLLFLVFLATFYFTSKVIIPAFVLLFIYRFIVWIVLLIVKHFRKDLHSLISGQNAFFVGESPDKSLTNILLGFVIQGQIPSSRICQLFQERVLGLEDSKGNLVYEKLKYTWTHFMGYAVWKLDSEFSLSNHVRDYDYQGELLLPENCSEQDLQRIWPLLAEAPWRINESPWEVLTVQNYRQSGKIEPHTLIIFRVDHVHSDVRGVIGLFRVLFKSTFSTTPKKPSKQTEAVTMSERFRNYFRLPYETAQMLFHIVRGRKIARRYGDSNMCCSISSNISEERIESTKNMHSVDYSSVVFSAIVGAVARALKSSGREPPEKLDLGYVFPMQEHPGGWQSHFNILVEGFPCKANSSQERLLEIQRVFNKDRTLLISTLFFYMRVLALLPSRILRQMTQFCLKLGPSIIMSNSEVQLNKEYVDGLEAVDIFTGVSLSSALGMLITSWGVNGQQRFNFLFDKYIFGDETSAMKLATYFEEELEALQILERSPLYVY